MRLSFGLPSRRSRVRAAAVAYIFTRAAFAEIDHAGREGEASRARPR
jgi:hypothetical protein